MVPFRPSSVNRSESRAKQESTSRQSDKSYGPGQRIISIVSDSEGDESAGSRLFA